MTDSQMDRTFFICVCLFLFSCRYIQGRGDPDKIGVILDEKSNRLGILAFAWQHYKLSARYDPADSIDISDNHRLITSMCSKMADGILMMIVDNDPTTYSSVQSYAQNMCMPTLIPSGSGSSPNDTYNYDITLLPPTTEAIVAVIKHFHWHTIFYYLWDTNDGLLRLQKLYQSFNETEYGSLIIRARRINNVDDCYDMLRKIDHRDPLPKRIVLDLSSRAAYENVLQQIVDVGMNREGYHYILGGLGIDELDLTTFVYGGVNITGFSVVDTESHDNRNLLEKAKKYEISKLGTIRTEEALVVDTVLVIDEAVTLLNEENSVAMARSRSRSRFQRQYSSCQAGSSCCNCSGQPMDRRYDGKMVLDTLKRVKTYGLTGNIQFDREGIRKKFAFKVHQLEHKIPLRHVGHWTPKGGLNTSLPKAPRPEKPIDFTNRTLRVTTILEDPFVSIKRSADANGAPLVNGNYLEGYCIDLAAKVHEVSETKYDYIIDLVRDSNYGKANKDLGCWNGMMGELLNDIDCQTGQNRQNFKRADIAIAPLTFTEERQRVNFKRADIAIAPLTITEERQRVVDFTKPFMQTGISIMIKKPDKEKPGVFSFMYPLSNEVWFCVMVAFVAVSFVLFLVGRWSPYEWTDVDIKGGSPHNNFSLYNTFWFSLGALMQQGSDTFPRSYSGRIVGSAWWFFTLILISSYTANLAAFLTIERLLPPIKSADDLVNQHKIEYGTLRSGSSRRFFETSKVDTYRRMWQFMAANKEKVLMDTVSAGVEKVRTSKGLYAFMLESPYNAYQNQRKPCNTMQVADNLDSKGYGIATPLKFYLRPHLNLAVLYLREIGELHKLKQKWWYAKGECGTTSKAPTSALTLSNVSGIFHILVGGLVLAMVVALLEYFIHKRIRATLKKKRRDKKEKQPAVRIVKKQTLEALKEVGYNERETTQYGGFYPPVGQDPLVTAPLVTFDSGGLSSHNTSVH